MLFINDGEAEVVKADVARITACVPTMSWVSPDACRPGRHALLTVGLPVSSTRLTTLVENLLERLRSARQQLGGAINTACVPAAMAVNTTPHRHDRFRSHVGLQ
ncbi:MAG: hypothetical protein R3B90_07480 [Planctomycetaceae bacterium]